MFYVLMGEDAPGTLATRLAVRAEHLARLHALRDQGRLLLAGPLPAIDSPDPGPAGFIGSLIVAEFDAQAQAEEWFRADPFVRAGVYARISVQPFLKTLP